MTNSLSTTTTHLNPETATLKQLLNSWYAMEQGMLEVDLEQCEELYEAGRIKIDSCKYVIERLEVMAELLERKENEYKKAKKALENQVARLKGKIIYAMESNGSKLIAGNEYMAEVRYSAYVDPKLSKPGDHHKIFAPKFVRTKLEWDKDAIGPYLKGKYPKDDPESEALANVAKQLAHLSFRAHVDFSILYSTED